MKLCGLSYILTGTDILYVSESSSLVIPHRGKYHSHFKVASPGLLLQEIRVDVFDATRASEKTLQVL